MNRLFLVIYLFISYMVCKNHYFLAPCSCRKPQGRINLSSSGGFACRRLIKHNLNQPEYAKNSTLLFTHDAVRSRPVSRGGGFGGNDPD